MNSNLDEDTYSLAISVLLRDSAAVQAGEGRKTLRTFRFGLVFLLVFFNMSIQVFLLFQVLHLVTPTVVNNLRRYYDKFEWHMYGEDTKNFRSLKNGVRGLDGHFMPQNFETLDLRTKKEACHIPFSEPSFFLCVLFIWTLTCVGEVKKCLELFYSLIVYTPTVDSIDEILKKPETKAGQLLRNTNVKVIVGLTWEMKVFIGAIILLPRVCVSLMLLWLGSRWLAATNDFGDLIMNSVALEFILLLQTLLYFTIVPARNKRDCQNLEIMPPYSQERAGFHVFAFTFLWGLVALAWSVTYTFHLQYVLPDYNWDVREVCATWLKSQRAQFIQTSL